MVSLIVAIKALEIVKLYRRM